MPEAGPEAYSRCLWRIEEAGLRFIVVGGQAVYKWAEIFLADEPALAGFKPFTSMDCDIVVEHPWKHVIEATGGHYRLSDGPESVQLAIWHPPGSPGNQVDFLQSVYGIRESAEKLRSKSILIEGIPFMQPLELFKSKCACFINLPQAGRQDEKHLNILRLLIPKYFLFLLKHLHIDEQRHMLRQLKQFRAYTKATAVRQALAKLGWNRDSMIPIDQLRTCGLPLLESFAQSEWPAT